jgi:hypothetical protein
MPIGADQFIGNFKGKIKKSMSQCGDMAYTWAVNNLKYEFLLF